MSSTPLDKLLNFDSDRVSLAIKVWPKSHQDRIKGIVDLPHGRVGLGIAVRPPAVDGAANEAVVGLLARFFDVPRSSVEINSGITGRVKIITIKGALPTLRAKLDSRASPP